MFRIHDPSVDPDAPGGPLAPVGALISTNREQLWVGSLQEDIDVRLVLEEWDEAPPPCGDAWDEEAKGSIYLRGQLSISMGLAGTAVRGLRLAGGVGDYSVRVYAGNRDQVTRATRSFSTGTAIRSATSSSRRRRPSRGSSVTSSSCGGNP
jgi:hypothetical protein